MNKAKIIGNIGENIAEKYLKRRFWHILSRNYTAHGGEIDIIAYRFGVLAYFEVKARSNDDFGRPSDAVDAQKISRIKRAALNFTTAYRRGNKIPVFYPFGQKRLCRIKKQRIDVIEIYFSPNYKTHKINYIKDWEQL